MCADGMTEARVIASNKFAVDCLLANINMSVLFLYLLFVSTSPPFFLCGHVLTTYQNEIHAKIATFHPRKHYGVSNAVSSADPSSATEPSQQEIPMTAPKRFSQRVTSFIGQRFPHRMVDTAPTDSFQQTFERKEYDDGMVLDLHNGSFDRYDSKTFIRPMSPVSVDAPPLVDTVPLKHVTPWPRPPPEQSDWLRRSPDRRNY